MSRSFLLQDWTTVRSSLDAPFVQDPSDWLDLDGFSDVVCWLDVGEVTPPGGSPRNFVQLQIQTAPSFDDAYFVPISGPTNIGTAAPFFQASTSPTIIRSAKSTVSNNLMRYLRWSITPSTNGPWDITFRLRAIAARSATFVPPLIAGCQAWFRPDLGITLSAGTSNITRWTDQSGTNDTNKNLVATGTPTLNGADASYMNQPTVSFSGSTQYFTSGSWVTPMTQPNTWIIVGHRTSTAPQMDAMDGATSGYGQLIAGGVGNNTLTYAGTSLTTPTASQYAWTSPSVVLAEFVGTASNIYMNDFTNVGAHGNTGTASFDALSLGSHNPAFTANNFWAGTIAEVIAYAGTLSSTAKAQLRQYFRGRYGIAIG